jgi:hypothetical protein
MKNYEECRYRSTILTRYQREENGRLQVPVALPPGTIFGVHCIGGWIDLRASPDVME